MVAGVIYDQHGRLLLSQRPAGKHLAGTWEFPGGKLEAGESRESGLARELAEELGIQVLASEPLLSLTHQYADRSVRLWLRAVSAYQGQPVGREGQALDWIEPAQAHQLAMPAADRPMLKALDLDPRYVLAPEPDALDTGPALLAFWQAALRAGYRWLQFPDYRLPDARMLALARDCSTRARAFGARWLLQGDPELVESAGADGIHLDGPTLQACSSRPVSAAHIACASCRGPEDLDQAGRIGLDFVILLPSPAENNPSTMSWDWADFADLCARSPLPVLAAGALAPADLALVRAHGGFGVAGRFGVDEP